MNSVADGSIASRIERKDSPCQQRHHVDDSDSEGAKDKEEEIFSQRSLPEDVWSHIHSVMDMRDAARAACLSRSFLQSWRRHPHLDFDRETLRCRPNTFDNYSDSWEYQIKLTREEIMAAQKEIASDFYRKVNRILNKHSKDISWKTLKICVPSGYTKNDSIYLDCWLQIAVASGIEELVLRLPPWTSYKFPCSPLYRSGDSIQCLHLAHCFFNPTIEFGWLKNMTKLELYYVVFNGDELECLLSASLSLERLEVVSCNHVVCLKIPSVLQRLTHLKVIGGESLRVMLCDAPNITYFKFQERNRMVKLPFGEASSQIKELDVSYSGAARSVRVNLPSIMPNLETVTIFSSEERANIPMLDSKYLHLKNLRILLVGYTFSPSFDYFSLVSYLDACPSLETFALDATQWVMEHVTIITHPSVLRRMPEQRHHKLKNVEMTGFTSATSLVELACHIAECSASLEFLKLEVYQPHARCYVPAEKQSKCSRIPEDVLMEAWRADLAIRTYIEPKVPSTVKLQVLGPCSRCHPLDQQRTRRENSWGAKINNILKQGMRGFRKLRGA